MTDEEREKTKAELKQQIDMIRDEPVKAYFKIHISTGVNLLETGELILDGAKRAVEGTGMMLYQMARAAGKLLTLAVWPVRRLHYFRMLRRQAIEEPESLLEAAQDIANEMEEEEKTE